MSDRLHLSPPTYLPAVMRVLSDILRSLRFRGSVYFCERIESPWRKTFRDSTYANFHMVRSGQCYVMTKDTTYALVAGDFVFVEPGCEHVLTSGHLNDVTPALSSETMLLCGYCQFDADIGHPLLQALPAVTIIRADELRQHVWLRNTLDQLASEHMSQMPGSETVVDRLTEILFVEVMRVRYSRRENSGFIAAFHDRAILRALTLLHAEPQQSWTINKVARTVGLSRAALAKRFKQRVGQTLNEYLTRLRMGKARDMLTGSTLPVQAIATHVGYESDIAFAKAFKRVLGQTPSRYRKEARPTGAAIEP